MEKFAFAEPCLTAAAKRCLGTGPCYGRRPARIAFRNGLLHTMIPIFGLFPAGPRFCAKKKFAWGRSHTRASHGATLKNLGFDIEPAANPLRPTLRDGH